MDKLENRICMWTLVIFMVIGAVATGKSASDNYLQREKWVQAEGTVLSVVRSADAREKAGSQDTWLYEYAYIRKDGTRSEGSSKSTEKPEAGTSLSILYDPDSEESMPGTRPPAYPMVLNIIGCTLFSGAALVCLFLVFRKPRNTEKEP